MRCAFATLREYLGRPPWDLGAFALQQGQTRRKAVKISLAKFYLRATLSGEGGDPIYKLPETQPTRRAKMAWKAPKIVEVPVGMEINMYACAARK